MFSSVFHFLSGAEISKQSIEDGLNPKSLNLRTDFMDGCSHRVDSHKGSDAECGRKEGGEGLPERGCGTLGPRYAGEKKQEYGSEDHHQHHVLALSD